MENTAEMQSEIATSGEVFRIDSAHSQQKIRDLPLSKRATSALTRMGIQKLGDLDGFACDKLLLMKNCGSKTYNEIVRLVDKYTPGSRPAAVSSNPPASPDVGRLIAVPEYARSWSIQQLPLSVRLDHVLQKLNCRILGDLHGMTYNNLLDIPNCGVRTQVELQQLIAQVEKGEFSLANKEANQPPVAFLVERIDAAVNQLSPKWRQIFLERLGGTGQPMALAEVGRKFNMTRERVRQIVDMLITRVMRSGGPAFVNALQNLGTESNRQLWPLTPQLFKELIAEKQVQATYSPAFYIRLLGWLSPELSAWPGGQTPTALRTPELERIIMRLKKWFDGKNVPVPFLDAYQGIQGEDFSCAPVKFMEALRYAAEFEITLDAPRNPLVKPPVEFPRRWAQSILAQSQESTIAPETVARARAILQVRRSPRSDYRLVSSI
jgi:hypothetical protein